MPRQSRQSQPQPQQSQSTDKAAKFAEIAPRRVVKVLDAMDTLGNVFNRANYTYTDEQVDKIFTTLDAKVDELRALTQENASRAGNVFTL